MTNKQENRKHMTTIAAMWADLVKITGPDDHQITYQLNGHIMKANGNDP